MDNIDISHVGDDLAKAYEQGVEDGKPKWIPVSKRLPEEKDYYLVYAHGVVGTAYYGSKWWTEDTRIYEQQITHWMPMLPEPPKDGE